jgi:hypothetical protein
MSVKRVITCDICREQIDGRYYEVVLTDTRTSEAIKVARDRARQPGQVHPKCLAEVAATVRPGLPDTRGQ